MAITFPNSPAENELWTVDGRAYYIYKTPAWRQVMAKRPMRNRIVNARMQASQQNGDATGTAYGYYAADQWFLAFPNTPGAVTFRRVGSEGGRVLDIQITTATASPDYLMFSQNIEGWQISDFQWGTVNAKPVVLSFIFFSSISGQFGISFRNNDYSRSFVWPFVVTPAQASQWIQRTIPIPGDTAGTWFTDNRMAANVLVTLAASGQVATQGWYNGNAHALLGQVNGMATVGNLFRMTEAVLYLDPSGRGVPQRYETPMVFDNYRQCQRYLEKAGITAAGGLPVEPLMAWGYKTMKRANPGYSIIAGAPTGAGYGVIAYDGTWGFRENPQASNAVDHVVLIDARL